MATRTRTQTTGKAAPVKAANARQPAAKKAAVKAATAAPAKSAPRTPPVSRSASTKATESPAIAKASKETKESKKTKADKLVRDSFTMPASEFALLGAMKAQMVAMQRPTKKSELLRAGVKALSMLSGAELQGLLDALPVLKTGRPKKA